MDYWIYPSLYSESQNMLEKNLIICKYVKQYKNEILTHSNLSINSVVNYNNSRWELVQFTYIATLITHIMQTWWQFKQ